MKQTLRNLDSFHRHHGDKSDNNKAKTHSSNNEEPCGQDNTSTSKPNDESLVLEKEHQLEDERFNFNPNRKQSMITKVKEKAKKWKQTLGRKKHGNESRDGDSALGDYENDEGFESLGCSRNASDQHENRIHEDDPSSSRAPALGDDTANPRTIRSSTSVHIREEFEDKCKNNTTTKDIDEPSSTLKIVGEESGKTPSPSPRVGSLETKEIDDYAEGKTLAEAVTEKLGPDYNVTIFDPPKIKSYASVYEMNLSRPLTVTPSNDDDTNVVDEDVAYGVYEESGLNMDISVTNYIKNQLDPSEDGRVLCHVISQAMSPGMTPGDKGVMEKVKEVVTSLLKAEQEQEEREQKEQEEKLKQKQQEQQQQQQPKSAPSATWHSTSSSPQIPISTNAYEGEEENHGKILQAN